MRSAGSTLSRGELPFALHQHLGAEKVGRMFKLPNEKTLLAMFRPMDRRGVEITRDVPLPMLVTDYFTWSFGRRTFLVFEAPGCAPRGIVFEADVSGVPVPHMCAWCEAVAPGTRVAMMTARRDPKRVAGIMLCADLGCRERLEDRADRAGIDVAPAMTKLLSRMQRFAESLVAESRDDPERLLDP
jgi:hypothetical protein